MKIAISACLYGENCKYNGGNNLDAELLSLIEGEEILPVCPEVSGGLPTPRVPSEIVGDKVIMKDGTDVTGEFRLGALRELSRVMSFGAEKAILQPRSPSCGKEKIYDGTFSGTLTDGDGIFAQLLTANGIKVFTPEEFKKEYKKKG